MSTVVQAANPLPFLLEEERHGDHQATEAILLTFNVDLGFFEARALGACMSAGARVCVVADASVWSPDPYAARLAGRDYHVGLAVSPGAFHPKLIAVVGPKRALVAVGSGNLTMGGWQHNAETWTVFRADADQAPRALVGIADVLRDISSSLDPIASDALVRVAREIRGLVDRCAHVTDTGHRIIASTQGSIITQLPEGGAKEVWLYAPFHDPHGKGVAAVLQRLRPQRATVMVQPGLTVVVPEALERSLEDSGVAWQVAADGENAAGQPQIYRHGKLIEWTTWTGDRFALTGSPNLSYAALVAHADHGNTELAVLSPIIETLFPPVTPLTVAEVPLVQINPLEARDVDQQGSPIVLSAVLTDEGIQLTLARPLSIPATLEVSLRADTPDTWTALGSVAAEIKTPIVSTLTPIPSNSRVRLYDHANESYSPLMYVTDPHQVAQRRVTTRVSSRTASLTPADLWGEDLTILNALASDLADLAAAVAATKTPSGSATGPEGTKDARDPAQDTDTSPWLWLQTAAHHGPGLAAFALGMPAPPATAETENLGWIDQLVNDTEAELIEDTAEYVEADENTPTDSPTAVAPVHTWESDAVRRERRRRIEKWTPLVSAVPVASSLIVLRLTLVWWSVGDWDEDDPQPHHLVVSMLEEIADRDVDASQQLEECIASLGAVALTMLEDRIDPTNLNETTLAFYRARDKLSYLGLAAQENHVEAYCNFLRMPSGLPLDPDHVMDRIRSWMAEDPLADVVEAVEYEGHTVTRVSARLLRIEGTFSNPEQIAVRAVDRVDDSDLPIGVWAISDRGGWAFVAWDRPDLIRVTQANGRPMQWRHQRLTPLLGPASSSQPDGLRGLVKHGPLIKRFPIADDMLGGLGVIDPTPS